MSKAKGKTVRRKPRAAKAAAPAAASKSRSVKATARAAKPHKTTRPKLKSRAQPAAKPAAKKAAATKKSAPSRATAGKPVSGQSIMESAQHIWLAGLGAFAKAQEEGGRLFESLIKEGSNLESRTRKLASGGADNLRGAVETSVSQVRERTQETWDRLEQVFEDRVSRALSKLGVPGRKELDALLRRVEELNEQVRKIRLSGVKSSLSRVMSTGMRRARDDLSDLARELEEAQLAAKKAVKRGSGRTRKSTKSGSR